MQIEAFVRRASLAAPEYGEGIASRFSALDFRELRKFRDFSAEQLLPGLALMRSHCIQTRKLHISLVCFFWDNSGEKKRKSFRR